MPQLRTPRRTCKIETRLTQEIYDRTINKAEKLGMSAPEYLRLIIVNNLGLIEEAKT